MAIDNSKVFNVRIKNKYDSYENWAKSGIVLEAGEIAIASTTVNVNENGVNVEHPALLMKVGDGAKTFSQLPWMSAKAADVLSVCKSETDLKEFVKDVINNAGIATTEGLSQLSAKVKANEDAIDALELLVGDESVQNQITAAINDLDLANTYDAKGAAKAVQDELDAYKTLNDTAVQANEDAIAAINNVDTGILAKAKEHAEGLDSAMNTRMETVEALLTGSGEGTVAEQIAAVQDEVDALEETHATDKETLENAIALKADKTALDAEIARAKAAEEANATAAANAQSAAEAAQADIDAFLNAADVGEAAVDTLKEIQSYIDTDGAAADKMTKDIAANATAIEALQKANAEGGTVANAIAEAKQAGTDAAAAVEALEAGAVADNTAAIAKEVTDREAAITQEVTDRNSAIATAKQEAIDAAAADATTKANDAKNAAITAAATDAQSKADAAQAAAEATAAADATTKANQALADAKTHVAGEIAKLDGSVEVSSAKHVLTGVTEVDGKLTEKTEVELANVAFTGSTDDLVQGTMTLVFDCGGAV